MEILYINNDKQHKRLPNYLNIQSTSVTIYNQTLDTFGISVLQGEADIYSVHIDDVTNEPVVTKITSPTQSFNNGTNYQYTIYPKNKDVLIRCQNGLTQEEINFQFEFVPYTQPEHYDTILTNRDLPSYDELERCIVFVGQYDTTDLVARMLLDANDILRYKGNILGITKFLNFVGFPNGSFDLYREYKKPNGQTTFNPDKKTDIPTGYYGLLIRDYYSVDPPLTRKNLPNLRNLINQNTDAFIDKLRESFAIAMRYFTLPEQDISFIGIETSSNGMGFVSVTGNTTMIVETNPHVFRRSIDINISNHETSELKTYLVKHNYQQTNTNIPVVNKSEVKYITSSPVIRDIMVIDQEVYDDIESFDLDSGVARLFGYINHIDIKSPDTYVQITITSPDNMFINLLIPKQYVGDGGLYIPYMCTQSGRFNVEVRIWDRHNNMEVYNYQYVCSSTVLNAKFDLYTSHELIAQNDVTLDVDTTTEITNNSVNYVLPLNMVPENLSEYYDVPFVFPEVRKLTNFKRYRTKALNPNYSVDSLTETIPVDYIDNYQHIISIPLKGVFVNGNYQLVIRPKSISKELSESGNYFPLDDVYNHPNNFEFDELFVTVLDIVNDDSVIVKHLFITTKTSSIDITRETFDLGILNIQTNAVTPIYDFEDLTETKIQVNYDYPLFHREILPALQTLVWPIFDEAWKPISTVKSLFTRLTKLSETLSNSKILHFGDYIMATIDTDTITNQKDITWKVLNSFTNEVIYTSKDGSLKFQINERTVYTIILEMTIDNLIAQDRYVIDARNVITSFKFQY